jgi:hypothetical protein
MEKKDHSSSAEQRHYIRLDTVFPVEFRLVSPDGRDFLSPWLQGFTHNISKGGICLEVNNLEPALLEILKSQKAYLSLAIEMPFAKNPVSATAKMAWAQETGGEINKHLLGLSYLAVDPRQGNRMVRYAWAKKLFVPIAVTIIFILGLAFSINSYLNLKLSRGNKALVSQLIKVLGESSAAKQRIKEISQEREDLELKIQAFQSRLKSLEEEKNKAQEKERLKAEAEQQAQIKEESQKVSELSRLIAKTTQEKNLLQEQLSGLQEKERSATEELLRLDQNKLTLEKANIDKMYQWLKIHQNHTTGLVMSFEGDRDINNWAFIYDQALVIEAYTYFGDFERARRALEFFDKKAKRVNGRFANAYYANDGSPAEFTVHAGPNLWLGIAVLQYVKKTGDRYYLKLARDVAQGMISLQNQDSEGGLRGGPDVTWYATEHNLDGYAFFNMLYQITNSTEHLNARDKILNWLLRHTYAKSEVPIMRGKGDSTIATDTYAWSIAAIGPGKLQKIGMNPDKIMEFAEKNCRMEVAYGRPDGKSIKVKGFDFAPERHLARGGVVSSEWTAQMILSFKIMADFYQQNANAVKARYYQDKYAYYLAELGKMIISSSSPSGQGESCLPYATHEMVDTGHGWITPKGSSTGSLSGTAYAIFAYYGHNPLAFNE